MTCLMYACCSRGLPLRFPPLVLPPSITMFRSLSCYSVPTQFNACDDYILPHSFLRLSESLFPIYNFVCLFVFRNIIIKTIKLYSMPIVYDFQPYRTPLDRNFTKTAYSTFLKIGPIPFAIKII